MSAAEDFYYSQDVNFSGEQVNCYTSNDEQFVHYQTAQRADNRAPITTVVERPQHYSAEYHVKEGYQNECFVHSKRPDGQAIQHCDDTLNRQEHQYQYDRISTAAYAYDIDLNSQDLIFQQSDHSLLPDKNYLHSSDKIDVPHFSEPQGQYVDYNMSRNDFTSALQEYNSLKTIGPIRNVVQKSKPSITAFPNCSFLYSESEIKRILSLPLLKRGRLVPRNLGERIMYELLVRNISRRKFAKNVLGRSAIIFYDMFRSSEEWDKLRRTRQEQYEKMKEWLDMSEDQKKAAVERESNYVRCRNSLTQEQREALESHFKEFPEARKPELVGLADQLQLPSQVVATYFNNQRAKRKHQRNQHIVTKNLSRRILYELYARGIPQETFARSVIGRAQGTFSALVTHPKKWNDMKAVGRMPYLKMKKWLDLTEDEKKAVVERTTKDAVEKTTQSPVMKAKRTRTVFTQAQREALDAYFRNCPNAHKPELERLAYQFINTKKPAAIEFFVMFSVMSQLFPVPTLSIHD